MAYYAEIDNTTKQVLRVIVADDPDWIQQRLGGNWVETKIDDKTEQYAGIGQFAEEDHPKKFAPQWKQPTPGVDLEYQANAYAWHNGRIWQSTSGNQQSVLTYGNQAYSAGVTRPKPCHLGDNQRGQVTNGNCGWRFREDSQRRMANNDDT